MSLKPFAAVPKTDREWQKWIRETHDLRVLFGAGSPLNVVTANKGTLYLRSDGGAGTTLYVKEADSGLKTGWAPK